MSAWSRRWGGSERSKDKGTQRTTLHAHGCAGMHTISLALAIFLMILRKKENLGAEGVCDLLYVYFYVVSSREVHGVANIANTQHLAPLPALRSSQRRPAGRAARGIIPGRRDDFPACSLHRAILAHSLGRARSCYTHLSQLEGRLQKMAALKS